jgi:RNA polymerase sigma factor (sigma-70 family)
VATTRPLSSARSDAAAFALVYDAHHRELYHYCRHLLRDEHDAQQSTMERAFASLRHERLARELRPWLFRIAHNEAVSILRLRRRTAPLDERLVDGQDIEALIAEREELRALRDDLAVLSQRQREALLLRELRGLGHADIAQLLGCSRDAAKQAICEARRALHECREGREMACDAARRALSGGDARRLRGRGLRSHLRACAACRRFQAELAPPQGKWRSLSPPLLPGAVTLLRQLLAGSATATGSASGLVAGLAEVVTAQVLVSVAAVAIAAGGAGAAFRHGDRRPVAERPASVAGAAGAAVRAPGHAATTATAEPDHDAKTGEERSAVPAAIGPPSTSRTPGEPGGSRPEAPSATRGAAPAAASGEPATARSAPPRSGGTTAEPARPVHGNAPAADRAPAAPARQVSPGQAPGAQPNAAGRDHSRPGAAPRGGAPGPAEHPPRATPPPAAQAPHAPARDREPDRAAPARAPAGQPQAPAPRGRPEASPPGERSQAPAGRPDAPALAARLKDRPTS